MGHKTWEELALEDQSSLSPSALSTFVLREVHWDAIRAGQHIMEELTSNDNYFPPQLDSFVQEKAEYYSYKHEKELKIRALTAPQTGRKSRGKAQKFGRKVRA